MKPPSERARRVLDRYKAASAWGANEKARLGALIRVRVWRGDAPRFEIQPGTASLSHASLAPRIWGSTLGNLGTAILIVGAANGIGYQLQKGFGDSELRAPALTVARTRSEASEAKLPAPVAPPAPVVTPLHADATSMPPRTKSEASNLGVVQRTIDDEVPLVSGAQTALRAGNTARALQLLKEHETRFPTGKLATLRQVTYMIALCQTGRASRARQEAARFLARNPNSPFAERVSGICSAKSSP